VAIEHPSSQKKKRKTMSKQGNNYAAMDQELERKPRKNQTLFVGLLALGEWGQIHTLHLEPNHHLERNQLLA
jgi:hypothetical protein